MRNILIIASREIVDKKLLFLGAAMCALIILLIPLLPGARDENPVQVMTAGALALGLVFIAASSVFLGFGIISRDLAEGRMSFYLARPVSMLSVWAGKILAVILISLGIGFIPILIPTLLGGGLFSIGSFLTDVRETNFLLYYLLYAPLPNLILLTLFLTAFSLFWGLSMRARSPWAALDLAVVFGTVTVLWIVFRPFLVSQAVQTLVTLGLIEAGVMILTLAVANFLGFRRGRSDLQATHKWTSIATATLLLTGLLAVALYAYSIRSFGVEDARYADLLDADDQSEWIAIAGRRSSDWGGYWKVFLLNISTGESISVPDIAPSYDSPIVRMGGGIALLWKIRQIDPPLGELVRIDLASGAYKELGITVDNQYLDDFAMSSGGEAAAWVVRDQVSTIDPSSGQSLFSVKLPQPDNHRRGRTKLHFKGPSTLLAYVLGEEWTIYRIDLIERRIEATGAIPDGWFLFLGEHLFFYPRDGSTMELRRSGDGQLLTTVELSLARVLSKGRWATANPGETTRLRIFNPLESDDRTIELPGRGGLKAITEPTESSLLVALSGSGAVTIWYVDLDSGDAREVGRGMEPSYWSWIWSTGTLPRPGSTASRILNAKGTLYLFDPEKGDLKRLTGSD